jgi:putative transcriptional regulator
MAASISKLNGHLLVATPNLIDTHFSKSVIYICEHDEQGVLGVMINKPLGAPMQRIFDQLGIEAEDNLPKEIANQDIMMGGPIGTDHGFILYHEKDASQPLHISTSSLMLADIAHGKGPEEYIVSLGYAGWEPEQLQAEICRNDWLVVPVSNPISRKLLFDVPMQDRWHTATGLLGYPPHTISSQVGHA